MLALVEQEGPIGFPVVRCQLVWLSGLAPETT